jgi:hypothetical protein
MRRWSSQAFAPSRYGRKIFTVSPVRRVEPTQNSKTQPQNAPIAAKRKNHVQSILPLEELNEAGGAQLPRGYVLAYRSGHSYLAFACRDP